MVGMRRLTLRVDDDVHAALTWHATREHRSLNSPVSEILRAALDPEAARDRVSVRLRRAGKLVVPPPPPGTAPSLDEVIEANRGSGTAVSEALEEDRAGRDFGLS